MARRVGLGMLLLLAIVQSLLVIPEFVRETNYMSTRGYARWQSYLRIGRWR